MEEVELEGLWPGYLPRMMKMRTPIGIALALLAPFAGWYGMGPALLYSAATPAAVSSNSGNGPSGSNLPDPQAAILAASKGEFEVGINALQQGHAAEAIDARDNLMPRDGIERRALTFAIVNSNLPGISSEEFKAASETLSGWPGRAELIRHYERAFYREHPSNDAILAAFKNQTPQTPEGEILLARAMKQSGQLDEAKSIVSRLWVSLPLNMWLEGEILKDFSDILTVGDHKARMDYLLYRDRVKQAARFAKLANAQPLFDAWSAVIRQSRKAPALLKAAADAAAAGSSVSQTPNGTVVGNGQKDDPALLYANIVYLEQKEDYDGAAKLLAKTPKDPETRVNSDEWWQEQNIVSRGLFEEGKVKEAYALASNQVAQSPATIADAEFHAGWFALTGLKDGALAATHFSKLLDIVTTAGSKARALYWLGRATQLNKGNGQDYFARAAQYNHTFYGLVAGTLVKSAPPLQSDQPTASDRRRFAARETVQAIGLFEKFGFSAPARLLYRELSDDITSPSELAILATRAKQTQDDALALEIGKKAYAMGARDASLAFPLGAIPEAAQLSGVQLALAYAISRQESGFNPQAVSPARAQGLMQLLPDTAKQMASQLGLAFAPDRLTDDAAYNAVLGTQYLDNQIKKLGGSYVLTFAAYNAGPGKVREWESRFGDPRGKSLEEVLNWIESVPYPETRNYVMRVMENFETYQGLLGLKKDIAADLSAGG